MERYLGPFKVLARIGQNVYKLKLPKKYRRLHHTFYVSLLEAYRVREGSKVLKPKDIDRVEEYEVEQILDERTRRQKTQFYIRWKGYLEALDSWKLEENVIKNIAKAITNFRKRKVRR